MQSQQSSNSGAKKTVLSKSKNQETLGFVIENITSLLPDFGEDPLLLGWIFHFTEASTTRTPIANIEDIRVSEMRLTPSSAGSYQMGMEDITSTLSIKAFVHSQKIEPAFTGNSSINYDGCLGATVSSFMPASDSKSPIVPLIENLEGYMCWADAAYIRATDLRLLKTYLHGDAAGYDDVFFSGAIVDYSTMNNARLRLEQRYLLLDPSILADSSNEFDQDKLYTEGGNTYLNSSTSFTLKAEPIYKVPPPADDGGDLSSNDDSTNSGNSVDGEMMPGAFPLIGCPRYWKVMQALRDEAFAITGNADNAMMPVTFAELDDMGAMMAGLNANYPPTDLASRTWLARLLRDLADFIDSIFSPSS